MQKLKINNPKRAYVLCVLFLVGIINSVQGVNSNRPNDFIVNQTFKNFGFKGEYVHGKVLNQTNVFEVEIINIKTTEISITFGLEDLVLSQVTGVEVEKVIPHFTNIKPSERKVITYYLKGAPNNKGILNGRWEKRGETFLCQTIVEEGSAQFVEFNQVVVCSMKNYKQGAQIIEGNRAILNNTNKQLIISMPYINGKGIYKISQSAYVQNNVGTGFKGDQNKLRIYNQSGIFQDKGSLLLKLEVDGDGEFNVAPLNVGEQKTIAEFNLKINNKNYGTITLVVVGGISDKRFGQLSTQNGIIGHYHNFVYLPIRSKNGQIWLNNNLGANYANVNHHKFNFTQQAKHVKDYHASGSLYQWGRYSDGHELISYDNNGNPQGVNTCTNEEIKHPNLINNLFIQTEKVPYNWSYTQNNAFWKQDINNPCPVGFRVPTDTELAQVIGKHNTFFKSDNKVENSLKLPYTGFRYNNKGQVDNLQFSGYYWSSIADQDKARYTYFNSTGVGEGVQRIFKTYGFALRCIKII